MAYSNGNGSGDYAPASCAENTRIFCTGGQAGAERERADGYADQAADALSHGGTREATAFALLAISERLAQLVELVEQLAVTDP